MKKLSFISFLLVSFALLGPTSTIAQPTNIQDLKKSDLSYVPPTDSGCQKSRCTHYVRGTITSQTVKAAQSFFAGNKGRNLEVRFDSLGGDVLAALELGRSIRKHVAVTSLVGGNCASACVLAFVGGVERNTFDRAPRFGIHTLYFGDTKQMSYDAANNRFKKIGVLVLQYLQDMNIPPTLYDEMLRYPADDMHFMTREELSRYRVLGIDSAEQDRRDSNSARNYGLDKRSYLNRKQRSKIECEKFLIANPTSASLVDYATCNEEIMRAN